MVTCQHTNLYSFHFSTVYSVLSDIFHQSMPASWIKHSQPCWPQSTVEQPQFSFEVKTLGEQSTAGWAAVTSWCHTRRLTCRIPSVHGSTGFQPRCQHPTEWSHNTPNRWHRQKCSTLCMLTYIYGRYIWLFCFAVKISLQPVAPLFIILPYNTSNYCL